MPTVYVSRQPSLGPSGIQPYMDWESESSGSDTDIGSDAPPSPPSSDIDPNVAPRTPSPVDPPAVSIAGSWSPTSAITSSSEKKGAPLRAAGTARTLVAEAIPERFWEMLKDAHVDCGPVYDLMDDIWSLRQEWLEGELEKFTRKVAYSLVPGGARSD